MLKFFDADQGSGIFFIRDPGRKKLGSGINIPDPQHWLYGCILCTDPTNLPYDTTIRHTVPNLA